MNILRREFSLFRPEHDGERLLKKYKYPPEDYDFAINTVISQCELWTDNADMSRREEKATTYSFPPEQELSIAAEEGIPYGEK